ncbi:MAG: Spy/CpxP family protein refolding chaperone [Burkholderiales bacterium]|nr:Spy/CpxP family protein refolding chaperone [Burkholderiales bacterium]
MREVTMASVARRRSALTVRLILGSVVLVAATSFALSAHAQGHHAAGGGGMGGGPAGMMMFGGTPQRIGSSVDRMLDGLNATGAQRDQIKQIVIAAAADLKAQRDAGRALHEKWLAVFMAPTVDAGAAEALRQQMLAQHDQASKRVLQAMLDVSKVLTPEQRAALGERMKRREAMMHERMQREHHERPKQ